MLIRVGVRVLVGIFAGLYVVGGGGVWSMPLPSSYMVSQATGVSSPEDGVKELGIIGVTSPKIIGIYSEDDPPVCAFSSSQVGKGAGIIVGVEYKLLNRLESPVSVKYQIELFPAKGINAFHQSGLVFLEPLEHRRITQYINIKFLPGSQLPAYLYPLLKIAASSSSSGHVAPLTILGSRYDVPSEVSTMVNSEGTLRILSNSLRSQPSSLGCFTAPDPSNLNATPSTRNNALTRGSSFSRFLEFLRKPYR